jgi:hypothetical protein
MNASISMLMTVSVTQEFIQSRTKGIAGTQFINVIKVQEHQQKYFPEK